MSADAVEIEALAALVDTTGTELWRISGNSWGHIRVVGAVIQPAIEGTPGSVKEAYPGGFDVGLGPAPPVLMPGTQGTPGGGVALLQPTLAQTPHDFRGACDQLLKRWRGKFPTPPRDH